MIKLTDEHREQLTRIADAGRAYDYTDETPAAGLADANEAHAAAGKGPRSQVVTCDERRRSA